LNIQRHLLAGAIAASLSLAVPAAFADEPQPQTQPSSSQESSSQPSKCRWWQFRCNENEVPIEGLPDGAPRQGTIITVDVSTHTAYLFQDGKIVDQGPAATGTGKLLKHGKKVWLFHTPQGRLKVLRKIPDPVWRKPDWAFIENGDPVPPPDSPKRLVKNHLGKYALDLGDGIMIHGTDDPDSLGRPASHGCIRLPADMLEEVYKAAQVGTEVYVFESKPPQTAAAGGAPEHHSDLD